MGWRSGRGFAGRHAACPLFTYIVADQFIRTRVADDTFGDFNPALGADIIAQVQESTFADIIERNTDVDMVQDDVFIATERSLSELSSVETAWRADTLELAAKTLNASLYTGSGNDIVTLSGGTTINGNIQMGRGDDTVTLQGTATVNGDVITDSGDDAVTLENMAKVHGNVLTGHNDDAVVLSDRAVIDGELCTGRGNDDITIGARATVGGAVHAGKGDDIIRVESGANITDVNGGKGFNTLQLDANSRVKYDANS